MKDAVAFAYGMRFAVYNNAVVQLEIEREPDARGTNKVDKSDKHEKENEALPQGT